MCLQSDLDMFYTNLLNSLVIHRYFPTTIMKIKKYHNIRTWNYLRISYSHCMRSMNLAMLSNNMFSRLLTCKHNAWDDGALENNIMNENICVTFRISNCLLDLFHLEKYFEPWLPVGTVLGIMYTAVNKTKPLTL